jgi:hypothetical protein
MADMINRPVPSNFSRPQNVNGKKTNPRRKPILGGIGMESLGIV